jgi:hypothetical protein
MALNQWVGSVVKIGLKYSCTAIKHKCRENAIYKYLKQQLVSG